MTPTRTLVLAALLGCGPTTQISIGSDLRDGGADTPDALGATDAADGGLLRCLAPPECFGRCLPESRPCTCGMVPEGLRCVPACMLPRDCPPGPFGMPLTCRLGACVP